MTPLNLLIAYREQSVWAQDLARRLTPLPIQVHWPRTQCEALNLATSAAMHMGVVDQSLPDEGGLGLVRAFRRLGLDFPCLLICDGADPRLLRQALELDIFSVISVETAAPAIWPMVVRALQRHYQLPWNGEGSVN